MAGDDRHPASQGPSALVAGGAVEVLTSKGLTATVAEVRRSGPFTDTASSSADVNRQLAALVHRAVDAGEVPIVLAGTCTAAMGVLGGADHRSWGVVWLDAHADFNTPESTASGFFPGMSLAIVTGHCYRGYWAQIGINSPIPEESVVLLGVRDVSPDAERRRLEASRLARVEWRDGEPVEDPVGPLDALARRVEDVYLRIDLDAFAPDVAPGVVDDPVPGGLSLAQAEAIIAAVGAHFRLRAATLATYTPERDHGQRTLQLGRDLLAAIGQSL